MNTENNKAATNSGRHSIWLIIMRVALGIILVLKGIAFFENAAALQMMVQNPGMQLLRDNSAAIAFCITYTHLLGGIFIASGLFTRWVSLVQIPILIGAVVFEQNKSGMPFGNGDIYLALFVLLLLFVFLIKGSGSVSVDEYIRTYSKSEKKSTFP
jgi:uncharacterized membrane protein YphA (DoxX/SURF4 family)